MIDNLWQLIDNDFELIDNFLQLIDKFPMMLVEGITDVVVVDIDGWRLAKARGLGAKTVNTSEENLVEGLINHFGTVNVYGTDMPNVDAFVDAAGAPPLFEQVMKIVKPNARVAVIAVYKQEVPISLVQVVTPMKTSQELLIISITRKRQSQRW